MNGLQFLMLYFLANMAALSLFMPRFPLFMQVARYEEKDSAGNLWSDKQIRNIFILLFMLFGFPILILTLLFKTFRY